MKKNRISGSEYEKNRFATLGILYSQIAHEILNPLGGVYAPLENLERKIETLQPSDREGLLTGIARMRHNLQRIEKIVNAIKVLGYRQKIRMDKRYLEGVIKSVLDLYQQKIENRIRIRYAVHDTLVLEANGEAFQQILINLLSNAIDSIRQEGEIEINLTPGENGPMIRIRDTGEGIKAENLAKVFDPFFTGKESGYGTGLGLSIVQDLARKIDWRIEVKSSPGVGSEFILYTSGQPALGELEGA